MIHRFKLRLLGVIVLVTIIGVIMQSGHSSKQLVEPVLQYIMDNEYDVGVVLSRYIEIPGIGDLKSALPVSGGVVLRKPCDFLAIERSFGWHWSQEQQKQIFNQGIYLKVKDDTVVSPMLSGKVEEITRTAGIGTVLIKHDANLFSLYGGLKEVLVAQGSSIGEDKAIGRTGDSFYFEVRGKDGPVNPQSIFK